jgi:hypothetical protein
VSTARLALLTSAEVRRHREGLNQHPPVPPPQAGRGEQTRKSRVLYPLLGLILRERFKTRLADAGGGRQEPCVIPAKRNPTSCFSARSAPVGQFGEEKPQTAESAVWPWPKARVLSPLARGTTWGVVRTSEDPLPQKTRRPPWKSGTNVETPETAESAV